MSKKIFVTPEYTTAAEIKNVRKKLGLTQKEFAELLGSSKSTVERWEKCLTYQRTISVTSATFRKRTKLCRKNESST